MKVPPSPGLETQLAAVARGDRSAFAALYRATSGKLFGIVLRIVRDRSVAEEVLQDVYNRIWQNASRFSLEAGQPMTWIGSIARHRAIDAVRRRAEVRAEPDAAGLTAIDRAVEPRDPVAEFIERDRIESCLDRLSDETRQCVVLAYVDGYSRYDLAVRFERPVNTVKTWLHRGLASLRA